MLNDKIRGTIGSISALSFKARVIADRLGVSTSSAGTTQTALAQDQSSDVELLKAHITELTEEVDSLRHLADMDADDAIFTDEQAEAFTQTFDKSLREMQQSVICSVYNRDYFKPYPRNIRYLLCLTLVNNFTSRNLTPQPIWYELVASNGSIS